MTGNQYETMIGISKMNRQRLRDIGSKGETYDQILTRAIDCYVNYKTEG